MTASAAMAQPSPDTATAGIDDRTAVERKAAADDPDRKVWNGVAADRRTKAVTLFAVATAVKPADPIEFFVAPVASGKDYEALAVTTAVPSDVKAALAFIGLAPGRPVDFNADRFWPRGPRVVMTFGFNGKSVRAEELIFDARAHRALVPDGLVFAGSYDKKDADGKPQLAADFAEARPIAPLYNDPAALLELPRQAMQSSVYGSQKSSPAWTAKPGEAIDVTLRPAAGAEAVRDWAARAWVKVIDGRPRYGLSAWDPEVPHEIDVPPFTDLPHFVADLARVADGTRDVFTTVDIDPATPVAAVRSLFAVLRAVEKDRGVKLDPPRDGGLFHAAYFPDPAWRDRTTRLGEPWELFLARDAAGKLSATLERQTDDPAGGEKKVIQSARPADPAALAAHVAANASQWSRTLFVYPPADLTYGELTTWANPARATLPRVFVFPADAAATPPAP